MINILHEDNHILVCEKPAGIPSQSDKSSDYDLFNQLKNYLFENTPKKVIPYLAIIHRLDRPVGGIMVFAKTPFSAKELSKQLQKHEIKKKYLAVVTADLSSELNKPKILLTDYIAKDSRNNLSKIVAPNDTSGKKASLYYRVLAVEHSNSSFLSLLDIELLTGRHHQIRVQMATHMTGIWGDTKYNPNFQKEKNWTNMALFAYDLSFIHPKTKKLLHFQTLPTHDIFQKFRYSLSEK